MDRYPLAGSRLVARFRLPVAIALATLVYGTLGYVVLEGWSALDAFYMSVITLTTVGFREVRPLDASGQLFTVSLLVLGVVALLSAVGVGTQLLASGELGEPLRRRRTHRRLESMHQHFLICGFGRVGRAAAEEFEREGVRYAVIDPDPEATQMLEGRDVPYLVADATLESVLVEAGVERARGLVCAIDSDAVNLYVTIAARALNPDLTIVARASRSESVSTLERAGADRVVSPYALSGSRMAFLSTRPAVVDFIDMVTVTPSFRLEEIHVQPGSPLDGARVRDASSEVGGATVLAIRKASAELVPSPDGSTLLEAGDLVVAMGDEEALGSLTR
jgi:voltage-gated potassium channel